MLHALSELATDAATSRALLLVNHVLAAEPVATDRLRRHAGRSVRVRLDRWPSLLPAPPALRWIVTPAGLFERPAEPPVAAGAAASMPGEAFDDAADLDMTVDASNPARLLAQGLVGRRPAIDIAGDAAFAADLSWVMDNVRWDIRDDLARAIGEWPAGELARAGSALAGGLRTAVRGLARRPPAR